MSASVSSVLRDDSPKDPKSPGTGTGTGSGPEEKDDTDAFPEGGLRAWLVAAGAASVTLSTLGYSNAYGVFQAYYQTHQLSDVGPSDISWIGGVQSFLTLATGVLGGPLFDRYGAWVCLFCCSGQPESSPWQPPPPVVCQSGRLDSC